MIKKKKNKALRYNTTEIEEIKVVTRRGREKNLRVKRLRIGVEGMGILVFLHWFILGNCVSERTTEVKIQAINNLEN